MKCLSIDQQTGEHSYTTLEDLFNFCADDYLLAIGDHEDYDTLKAELNDMDETEQILFIYREYEYVVIPNPSQKVIERWEKEKSF